MPLNWFHDFGAKQKGLSIGGHRGRGEGGSYPLKKCPGGSKSPPGKGPFPLKIFPSLKSPLYLQKFEKRFALRADFDLESTFMGKPNFLENSPSPPQWGQINTRGHFKE